MATGNNLSIYHPDSIKNISPLFRPVDSHYPFKNMNKEFTIERMTGNSGLIARQIPFQMTDDRIFMKRTSCSEQATEPFHRTLKIRTHEHQRRSVSKNPESYPIRITDRDFTENCCYGYYDFHSLLVTWVCF